MAQLERAAQVEQRAQKHPITPGALYPPYEALGDMLLDLDRPREALAAYERSLETWPGRYNTLLGAARAAREAGDTASSVKYYRELLDVVGDAATDRPGVNEAKQFVASR